MIWYMASPTLQPTAPGNPLIWALHPGEAIERSTLHERYGGRRQGGIGPSTTSPNVLIFADPIAAPPPGHVEGWRSDGCFHHTGEGQRGDQQMKSGNAAIRDHKKDGRALRLFLGTRGMVTYQGEFELAQDQSFYTTDAREPGNGPVRNVIVFRLRPLDVVPKPSTSTLDRVSRPAVEAVPLEEQWTEKAFVGPGGREHETDRREQALVLAFRDHLLKQGHDVSRLKIVPPGEAKPLFCDVFDKTTNTVYAAKGTVIREAIRMAIGQLLDYRRFLDPPPRLALLVPSRPRSDLLELLDSAGVGSVWRERKRFVSSALEGAGR
jgi:hypothetical protein